MAHGSGREGEACGDAGPSARGDPLGKSRPFLSAWGQRRTCPKGSTADSHTHPPLPQFAKVRDRGGRSSFLTTTLWDQGLGPGPDKTSLRTLGKRSPFLPTPTSGYRLTLDWLKDPLCSISRLSTRDKMSREAADTPLPPPILTDKWQLAV